MYVTKGTAADQSARQGKFKNGRDSGKTMPR
jgi:hypothetical protein